MQHVLSILIVGISTQTICQASNLVSNGARKRKRIQVAMGEFSNPRSIRPSRHQNNLQQEAELSPAARRMLLSMDRKQDGFLDLDEVLEFAAEEGLDRAVVAREFSGMDVNQDGIVDANEISQAFGEAPVPQQSSATLDSGDSHSQSAVLPAGQAFHKETIQSTLPNLPLAGLVADGRSHAELAGSLESGHGSEVHESMSHELEQEALWEAEAKALEHVAAELHYNATSLAKSTAHDAFESGLQAARDYNDRLLKKVLKLDRKAKKAEITAAALRSQSQADLEQADRLMSIARTALRGAYIDG